MKVMTLQWKMKKPDDIEEQLKNIKQEIKDKGGRPREGGTYGKDKHPLR